MKQNQEFILEMTKTIGMLIIILAILYGVFYIKVPDSNNDVVYLFIGTFVGGFLTFIMKSNKKEL